MAGILTPSENTRPWPDNLLYSQPGVVRAIDKSLAEGECHVYAATILKPIQYVDQAGQILSREEPPNEIFSQDFVEVDRGLSIFKLFLASDRIRCYLAYCTRASLPVRCIIVGPGILMPMEFQTEPLSYYPADVMVGSTKLEDWASEMRKQYARTTSLLASEIVDSPRDRAIKLVGSAITTSDREAAFLYLWRAIETVSATDLAASKKETPGSLQTFEDYFAPYRQAFLSEQSVELSIKHRVLVTLRRRVRDIDEELVRRAWKLRGVVAHAALSATGYRDMLTTLRDLFRISHDCVESLLSSS